MAPIVLLAGMLVLLYGFASMFAGGSVASAHRGREHSRKYALVTVIVGVAVVITGAVMLGA